MPRLLLVRHAESQNNRHRALISKQFRHDRERYHAELNRVIVRDPELSDTGHEQAKMLAEALGPALVDGGLLVCSPMRRALQTAMPMAKHAKLDKQRFVCQAELFEIGGRIYHDVARPSQLAAKLETEYQLRCCEVPSDASYPADSAAESIGETNKRVDRVISWAEATLASGEHPLIVVIAHGNLITRWLRRWMNVPWGRGLAFVHANTGFSAIDWKRDKGVLVQFMNDTRHLPEKLQTGGMGNWWGYSLPDVEIARHGPREEILETLAPELAALREQLPAPVDRSPAHDAASVHFLAWVDEELVGYVRYDRETGRLRQLVVSPSHRRGGLGCRLVKLVEKEAQLDVRNKLLVHVPIDSQGFFLRRGYAARGKVRTEPGGAWQPMVKTGLGIW